MKISKENKRVILINIFIVLIGNISTVFAYSLIANNVGFESKDTSWKASNTKEALDDLRKNVGGSITGQIISYMGTKAPYGYLVCDGSTYNIEDYPKLAEQIKYNFGEYNHFGGDGTTTFAVPDLRGEFLRGTGTNSHANQGNGSAVGIHQNATNHVYLGINTSAPDVWFPASGTYSHESSNQDSIIYNANKTGRSAILYNTWNGAGNGHYTSRPTNTSVLYLIKY